MIVCGMLLLLLLMLPYLLLWLVWLFTCEVTKKVELVRLVVEGA